MKTGAIIQARMSSSRLPGKVMKPLPFEQGPSIIQHLIRRIKAAKEIDEIILATSTMDEDKPLRKKADEEGIEFFTGSLDNVLERFYQAATKYELGRIVRFTGDCPCLDSKLIDLVIYSHEQKKADFTSTAIKRTWPHGMDFSVFNFDVLKEAHLKTTKPFEKEHVTPYIYKSNLDRFNINIFEAPKEYHYPEIRITIDTPEDYIFLCCVFDSLYKEDPLFTLDKIIALIKEKPWLLNINANVKQKQVHADLESEIDELMEYAKKQDLLRALEVLNKWKSNPL